MAPPRSTIYLIRHAESVHNVTKDFSIRDPGLTDLGKTQAAALRTTFPALESVGLIISSPLTRTIETTLAAFGNIIANNNNNKNNNNNNGQGGEKGVKLILDPNLQERSDLPCDTGSDLAVLEERFPGLGWFEKEGGVFKEGEQQPWWAKEGLSAADDAAVARRAAAVRRQLLGRARELERAADHPGAKVDIAVVTHGVFMKFLSEDQGIDLPKAGFKAYRVEERDGSDGEGEAVLVPV